MRGIRAIATAIAFAAIAARAVAAPHTTTPLTDQRGLHFTLEDLRGHPTVLTFTSAHCTEACPLIDAQIAQAADHERKVHGRLRFVTVSLDPEHDSVADLRNVANRFHADPAYWLIARATPQRTRELMREFGVVAVADGTDIDHTTLIYILDRDGSYAGSILPTTHLVSQLTGSENL